MSNDECNCNMIKVDKDLFKYLFVKSGVTEEELLEFKKLNDKPHYHNNKSFIKAEPPTFKVDKKKGEGKASKTELALRQELLNALEDAYKEFKNVGYKLPFEKRLSMIKPITDKYATKTKEIIKRNIPLIRQEGNEIGYKLLDDNQIGYDKKETTKNEAFDIYLQWKIFQMEMNAEYLRLDLTNKMYGNQYNKVAYGK